MNQPISAEIVYEVLQNSLSTDNPTRAAAEKQLHAWEADSVPGFISALLKIAHEVQGVPEESRLLAVVIAKNAVGSSWRKTVATREWSHVPDEEKAFVRNAAMQILFSDPSERVATHIALLISNIARFDVPRPWTTLLPDIAAAASIESQVSLAGKRRALNALKHTLRALRSKRFIMEMPNGVNSNADFEALSEQIDLDRTTMFNQQKALIPVLRQQWEGNFTALLQQQPGWEERGALAVAGLAALRELLYALTDLKDIQSDFDMLMSETSQAASQVAGPLFAGPSAAAAAVEAGSANELSTLLSKCWERLLQIALAAMDKHTVFFAPHVPSWASLCVSTAVGMDAAIVHHIRAKSRVLLTRFIARALLQSFYRKETTDEEETMLVLLPSAARQRMASALPALHAAATCLDDLISPQDGRLDALIQAIISKYIVLSPDELEEWESDPEGFARQMDLETSPDAETPRPCGVALLESMLERSEGNVSTSLVNLASSLQNQPLATREQVLARDAAYRSIGEVFRHLRTKVNFQAWYTSELQMMLSTLQISGLEGSVLRARALWLIGVCGDELGPESWAEAFNLAVKHMAYPDIVVALMAVSAVNAMVGFALEERQFVDTSDDNKRDLFRDFTDGQDQSIESQENLLGQANAEYNAHVAAVESSLDEIMTNCFNLFPNLGESESMVRLLRCVSCIVELLGDRVRPHLESITGQLPRVWGIIQSSPSGQGDHVRLHCSLLAMLAHLIGKLGATAANDSQISGVLLPLLAHATNTADPQVEPLIEDGLQLWEAVMQAATGLTPQLQELVVSRLEPLLKRGKDNAAALRITEAYILHGGSAAVSPIMPQLVQSITSVITGGMATMAPKQGTQPGAVILGQLTPEAGTELYAAVACVLALERVNNNRVPPELEGAVSAAATMFCADYGGGVLRLPARSTPILEVALEIIYRILFVTPHALGALANHDRAAADRMIDRWITLSSSRDIGELFIRSFGTAGRMRRHLAAVALCAVICADAAPGLRDEDRVAQALVLGLKAAHEQRLFEHDQQKIVDLKPEDPEHLDQLWLRRFFLARNDPLRAVDAKDALRAAGTHVAGWMGQEKLLDKLESIDVTYRADMAELLAGQVSEAEMGGVVSKMEGSHLS